MKIAIVNSVAGKSSKQLGDFLRDKPHQVDVFKPYKDGKTNFLNYDVVFNYGYGGELQANKVINQPKAVLRCVDKSKTFDALRAAGVDTVEYCLSNKSIPRHWDWVVVREEVDGRKAEGLSYHENKPGAVPAGALFTEYYEHKYEYRVVVLAGKVVGFYRKNEDGEGNWSLDVQPKRGFEEMGKQCVEAAKALGIDYVGFDVLANTKKEFKIIEANSAPILMDEAMEAIYSYVYN